jgi:hypothetical protein
MARNPLPQTQLWSAVMACDYKNEEAAETCIKFALSERMDTLRTASMRAPRPSLDLKLAI